MPQINAVMIIQYCTINFGLASHISSHPTRGRSQLKLKRKAAVSFFFLNVNKHSGYKVGSSHTRRGPREASGVRKHKREAAMHPKKSLSSCRLTDFLQTRYERVGLNARRPTDQMCLEVFCLIWIYEVITRQVVFQICNSSFATTCC